MAMVNITVPIQVTLPDDWIEQIVNRLRNDPESEWVEIVRCKDCKFFVSDMEWCEADEEHRAEPDAFCSWAERRSDD